MVNVGIIGELQKEVDDLRNEVKRLHDTMKFLSDNETNQILYIFKCLKTLDDEITHIYDVVGPLEEKIFPNVRAARRKLWSIMDEIEKRGDQKSAEKKS